MYKEVIQMQSTAQKRCMQIGLDSEEPRVPVEALQKRHIVIEATDVKILPPFGIPLFKSDGSTRVVRVFTGFTLLSDILANTPRGSQHLRLLHKTTTLRREKGCKSLSWLLSFLQMLNL